MPVSEKLAFEIFYIEFWHILSLLLFLGINYYIIIKARKSPLLYSYLSTQVMLILWIIAKIFKTVSPDISLRWVFISLQYFGASFIGGALFLFAYIYSYGRVPSKLLFSFILIPCFSCFLIAASNPLHFRFYASFTFYADSFGPLFYFNMSITYLYLTISAVMLARGFFKMFGSERIRAYLFLIGISVPILVNLFYILNLFEALFDYSPLFDYTPIATNVSLVLFALAAFRYRFLDILPIAGTQVFEDLSNPIVVIGRHRRIVAANKSMLEVCPQLMTGDLLPEELSLVSGSTIKLGEQTYMLVHSAQKNYTVLRFIDRTESENLLAQLKRKNIEISDRNARLEEMSANKKKLAEIKAERYVLQELHDILGHATVLAISACEVEILTGAENYTPTLSNIENLLSQGKEEFTQMLSLDYCTKESSSLLIVLGNLINSTSDSGLITNLSVLGNVFELSAKDSDAVYHICREAITNTLKHGKASSLNIVLRYQEQELELFLIDNGIGCNAVVYGKGLSGMQQRMTDIGGSIEFHSDEDCGFYIHAKVKKK